MKTSRLSQTTSLAALLNALAIGSVVLLLGACDRQTSPKLQGAANAATKTQTTVAKAVQPMQVIKLSDWPEIRNQFKGKVLVADLWASWCVSCIERFPAMVALSKHYRDRDVQFISLNLDEPSDSDALTWANNFLEKMQADFPHFHLNENMMVSFEQLNLLGIPVVLIYDSEGKERFRLTGDNPNNQFGDDDVAKAVEKLL